MFRNETVAVAGKAKAREQSKAKAKTPGPQNNSPSATYPVEIVKFEWDPASSFYQSEDTQDQSILLYSGLQPTLEERSVTYFSACAPAWLRHPDLLDDVCRQSNLEETLVASMNAVGLATLSNAVHAPELMVRARKGYVHALQLTNTALRSPVDAKKDSTLFSVMILGIYETVTGSNERSLAAWTEHINGAATLVKLRGMEQLQTVVGQRMFLQVTSSLMISCVQRTIAMPQHIIDLRKQASSFIEPDNPGWRVSAVIIDYTIFRADVCACKIVGPKTVIEAALDIDRRFIEVCDDLSEIWTYETIYSDENPHLIWNGHYHVYKESWMAHLFNGVRTCRIMLHETIRDQLLSASTAMTPIFPIAQMILQGQSSVNIMLEMQAQIMASIPHEVLSSSVDAAPGIWATHKYYFILWPLYVVGGMDLTTEPIRAWAVARLRDVGERAGIRQALLIANFLENKTWIRSWDIKPEPFLQKRKDVMPEEQREFLPVWNDEPDQELIESFQEDIAATSLG